MVVSRHWPEVWCFLLGPLSGLVRVHKFSLKTLVWVVLVDHWFAPVHTKLRVAHEILNVVVLRYWLLCLEVVNVLRICFVEGNHVRRAVHDRLPVDRLLEALRGVVGGMRASWSEVLFVELLLNRLLLVNVVLNRSRSIVFVPLILREENSFFVLRVNWRSVWFIDDKVFFVNIIFWSWVFCQSHFLVFDFWRCFIVSWHLSFRLQMSIRPHQ